MFVLVLVIYSKSCLTHFSRHNLKTLYTCIIRYSLALLDRRAGEDIVAITPSLSLSKSSYREWPMTYMTAFSTMAGSGIIGDVMCAYNAQNFLWVNQSLLWVNQSLFKRHNEELNQHVQNELRLLPVRWIGHEFFPPHFPQNQDVPLWRPNKTSWTCCDKMGEFRLCDGVVFARIAWEIWQTRFWGCGTG